MLENQNEREIGQTQEFDFLQEKIKERPINKKKLLQRTVITASLALLFGLVACVTFLILEPVLNNWVYPEEEAEIVTFPQEENEMLPEDMLTEDDVAAQIPQAGTQQTEDSRYENEPVKEDSPDYVDMEKESIPTEHVIPEVEQQTEKYQALYEEMYNIYRDVSDSIVTITAVKSDVNWFNNTYQQEDTEAGVIIANNNRELLILARRTNLKDVETIMVTFCDGESLQGSIKKYDVNTNLAVVAVELKEIPKSTMNRIQVATLGSSSIITQITTPVIAIGNIYGYNDSVGYGIITSVGNVITLADNQYKLLTTDIYASQNPSGILVNFKGQVVGIITNTYNHSDTKNLLSAVGITELKGMIEKLSNGYDVPYLGIYAQDVSTTARLELGVPVGAYIYDIDLDSPAMEKGIQKGDVITAVGKNEIRSAAGYMNALRSFEAGEEVEVVVMRASQDEYEQMTFIIEIESRN
ncbi:MAG: serine protease [Lachnospiraceae bacterium]|nr:serine protease [Lachnospiraceae bacterium]